jgi:hypothetical protein
MNDWEIKKIALIMMIRAILNLNLNKYEKPL